MTCDLYRFYDADERLLYVGISLHAAQRASEHRWEKSWWSEVARMDVEHLESRREALETEKRAIIDENPMHNVVHNAAPKKVGQLAWVCDRCCEIIADGAGYIGTDWRSAREPDGRSKWYATHESCDPSPHRGDYWFDVARCRTTRELVDWDDHLHRKMWIENTNWRGFITERIAA